MLAYHLCVAKPKSVSMLAFGKWLLGQNLRGIKSKTTVIFIPINYVESFFFKIAAIPMGPNG